MIASLLIDKGILLSQPNNNHNPNNKTTMTVVGLRLSNRWEPPTTETQNYKIESELSHTKKVVGMYEETPKQFLNPTPIPKIVQ